MIKKIKIVTSKPKEVLNITAILEPLAEGIEEGVAIIYIPHTTASLLLSEDDDELRQDIIRASDVWLSGGRPYAHMRNNNPNAEAHLLSAFGGTSVILAIESGKLDIGKYQNILFLEMDGPKEREIRCRLIIDKAK